MAILFEDDLPDLHSCAINPLGVCVWHWTLSTWLSSIDISAQASSSSNSRSKAVPNSNFCSGPMLLSFSVRIRNDASNMSGPLANLTLKSIGCILPENIRRKNYGGANSQELNHLDVGWLDWNPEWEKYYLDCGANLGSSGFQLFSITNVAPQTT